MSKTFSTPSSANDTAPTWIAMNFFPASGGVGRARSGPETSAAWLDRVPHPSTATEAPVAFLRNRRREGLTRTCFMGLFHPCSVRRLSKITPVLLPHRNACQVRATTSYSRTEGTSHRTTAPSCLKFSERPARRVPTLVILLPAETTNSTCWGPAG